MTLNQILKRIRTVILAHKQVRRFKIGLPGDLFADQTAKYPAACLMYNSGGIAIGDGRINIGFRLEILDLVNVSEDTKLNEDDVLNDTLSIISDIIATLNAGQWSDWRLSTDNAFQSLQEHENDLTAGWYVDFMIGSMFKQNLCEIPSDVFDFPSGDSGTPDSDRSKAVFDLEHYSTGTEGFVMPIPAIVGKKVLLVIREGEPLHKVSSSPDSVEYIWNDVQFTFGQEITSVKRFVILYRNY